MKNKEYRLLLPIGDWSHDGHGKCDWFEIKSNKSLEDVFEAYFKAQKIWPDLDPAYICNEYQKGSFSKNVFDELIKNDFELDSLTEFDYDICTYNNKTTVTPSPNFFAHIVAWYFMKGDPELQLEIVPEENVPKIINWNYKGENKDGFPSFGYGLFE